MHNHKKHLTPVRIALAAKTLQALDIEAEKVYLRDHQSQIKEELKVNDHEVSEMVESFNKHTPGQILLMDGHGYRTFLTLFANTLISVNLEELAASVIEAREEEDI